MFNLWNYLNTYSKFGKKMSSGEWFHDQQRVFVGASDMVFVSAQLQQLFTLLRYG